MSRLIAILLLAAAPALAQQPATPAPTPGQAPAARPPQGPQRPQVQSPVVEGDKATFAIYAPKAADVKLSSGEIDCLVPGPNKAFTKGENGVWTLTVAPLLPGIYDYTFDIDGVTMADPSSPNVFGNVRGSRGDGGSPRLGRVTVPRRVAPEGPHGSVTMPSVRLADADRCPPPCPRLHAARLRRATTNKYPVLYLLHGAGDNDDRTGLPWDAPISFSTISSRTAKTPMLIVMTDGHAYRPQQGEQGGREKA